MQHQIGTRPMPKRVMQRRAPKKQMMSHGGSTGGISGFGLMGGELLGGELLGGRTRRRVMAQHPSGGSWASFKNDMSKFANYISPVSKPIIGALTNKALAGIESSGAGRRAKLPKSGRKREVARGDIVAAVMKQQNISLGQASRYVKQHGLY